jgi:hypothetical protein
MELQVAVVGLEEEVHAGACGPDAFDVRVGEKHLDVVAAGAAAVLHAWIGGAERNLR